MAIAAKQSIDAGDVPHRDQDFGEALTPREVLDILEPREPQTIARELLDLAHAAEYARSRASPWTPAIRSPIDADKLVAAWNDLQAKIDALPSSYAALAQVAKRAAEKGIIEIRADGRIAYADGYRRLVEEFVSHGESRLLKGRDNEIKLILAAPAIALSAAAVQAAVAEARVAARAYFLPAGAEAVAQADWLALGPPPKAVNAVLASRPYRFAGIGIGVDIDRLNAVTYHAGMWSAAAGVWWFNHLHNVADDLASVQHLETAPILLIPHGQLIAAAIAALGVPLVLVLRRLVIGRRHVEAALMAARTIVEKLHPVVSAPYPAP